MRVQATKALLSSAPPPRNDRMGIQLTEDITIARFNMLIDWGINIAKWACPTTINQLGITNDFNLLCNRVVLSPFVFRMFEHTTLELLCTLTHNVNSMPPWNEVQGTKKVKFRLMNRDFDLSLTEWCNYFGFVNNDTHIRWANLSPSPLDHFHSMALYKSVLKGRDI
jgi:hypothetical protein